MRLLIATALLASLVGGISSAEAQTTTPRRARAARPTPTPEPMATPAPMEVSAPAVDGLNAPVVRKGDFSWDAFIDAAFFLPNEKNAVTNEIRGFRLNDAALLLMKDFGNLQATVDLPFSSDAAGGVSASNAFSFATERAQAYAHIKTNSAFFVRVGQYDTFFGMEANDSRDRFFANEGVLRQAVGHTFMGAQVGYEMPTFVARAQITNPVDRSALGNDNYAFAVHGRFDNGAANFGGGIYIQDEEGVANDSLNLLVNLNGGMVMNQLRLTGELDFAKVAGSDDSSFGLGALAEFRLNEAVDLGGRLEYINKPEATVDSIIGIAAGPAYRWSQDLRVRGDFSIQSVDPVAGDSDTAFGLTVSLVADL